MGYIKRTLKNLSLRKSFGVYMACYLILATTFSSLTINGCDYFSNQIKLSYGGSEGINYYVTDSEGELGNFNILYQQSAIYTKWDNVMLYILEIIKGAAIPVYFVTGILRAAYLFYTRKLKYPLEILERAADNIRENNLDFELQYECRDELGKLCTSFELMRKELLKNNYVMWRQMEERKRINAAFAHDLRTPLTVLKGYSELLSVKGLEEQEIQETAEVMHHHILRLERYVASMNQMQKLEDVIPVIQEEKVKLLESAWKKTVEILTNEAELKLSFTANLSRKTIFIDTVIWNQIYENIISNGVRYANSYLDISFSILNGRLRLVVEDDGPGFSKEAIRHGTDPFYSDAKSENQHFGLGLYICKNLCEAHGGGLRIENGERGGKVSAEIKCVSC